MIDDNKGVKIRTNSDGSTTQTEVDFPFKKSDIKEIMQVNNLQMTRKDVRYYDRFSKFGILDPYNKLTYGKEYLFFTKPDLHIYKPNTTELQPVLANDVFFNELANRFPNVIGQLQRSAGSTSATEDQVKSPFMNLLSNSVTNNLELQGLSAGTMDGPANMWGGTNTYRKDAWLGDENIEFSLEFEDTKTLDIYYLLKAYENYHRYMMAGYIYPPNISAAKEDSNGQYFDAYTANKELHTTFGIYKFIVDDDYSTILYYAYICGAYFLNVPRDAFNSIDGIVSDGLRFSVDFKAFCADDNNPVILSNFNKLVLDAYPNLAGHLESPVVEYVDKNGKVYPSKPDKISTYSRINAEWPLVPVVYQVDRTDTNGLPEGMKHKYELVWCSDKMASSNN